MLILCFHRQKQATKKKKKKKKNNKKKTTTKKKQQQKTTPTKYQYFSLEKRVLVENVNFSLKIHNVSLVLAEWDIFSHDI